MPSSTNKPGERPGTSLAIIAESLYLANLLLIPGIAFIALLVMYRRHRDAPPLAVSHIQQTISASLWAGALLIVANAAIILLGGYDGPYTWAVAITYFTMAHSTLILFGMIGLVRALAGQCWRYPLIGRPLPENCPK